MSVRVAYLMGSLNRGGTETLLLDVLANSGISGLEGFMLYRKSGGAMNNDFHLLDFNVNYFPVKRNIISYLRKLRFELINRRCSIAHAMQPIDAFYAYIALRKTGIKLILTLHGYDLNESFLSKIILNYIIRRTNLNLYVSFSQRDYYIKKYHLDPTKQQVVYNGISLKKISLDVNNRQTTGLNIRTAFSIHKSTLLLGMVGNFNHVRDHMTICRFLKSLNESDINFRFVFIGRKVDNETFIYDECVDYCITNGLSDRVIFAGGRQDVPEILCQLDGFIYSTSHDTFGIAVVEAMASGIPVFVNDWGVMQEITDSGRYATLYKSKDENDLHKQFMLFLQNKESYVNKGQCASDYVRKKFSIENHLLELKSRYEQLIMSE